MKKYFVRLICIACCIAFGLCSCENEDEKLVREVKEALMEQDEEHATALLHDYRVANPYHETEEIEDLARKTIEISLDNDNLACAMLIVEEFFYRCYQPLTKYMLENELYDEFDEFNISDEGVEAIVRDMCKKGKIDQAVTYIKQKYPTDQSNILGTGDKDYRNKYFAIIKSYKQ